MHRPTVGVAAICLFAIAGSLRLFWPEANEPLEFALWRVGIVMAALWLAHPQIAVLPRWLLAGFLALALVAAWKPKALWLAVPVAVVLWVLNKPAKR